MSLSSWFNANCSSVSNSVRPMRHVIAIVCHQTANAFEYFRFTEYWNWNWIRKTHWLKLGHSTIGKCQHQHPTTTTQTNMYCAVRPKLQAQLSYPTHKTNILMWLNHELRIKNALHSLYVYNSLWNLMSTTLTIHTLFSIRMGASISLILIEPIKWQMRLMNCDLKNL